MIKLIVEPACSADNVNQGSIYINIYENINKENFCII